MALDFDGVNDDVDCGNLTALNGATALTVLGWIRHDAVTNGDQLFGRQVANPGFWSRQTTAAQDVVFNTGITATLQSGVIVTGTYQHHGLVYDGSGGTNAARFQWYVNGVPRTVSYAGTIPAALATITADWTFGRASAGTAFANVTLGALLLYTAALSRNEITAQMDLRRPLRTAGLLAWWPFDDGTTARDYAGGGHHGTVSGAVAAAGPPVSYGG